MVKPAFLTPAAKSDLENIADWLEKTWGLKVLVNFLSLYEAKILVIAEYPSRYPLIHQPTKLRKAVLTKHNIILYREKDEHIEIVSIFDTRQDPGKMKAFVKRA